MGVYVLIDTCHGVVSPLDGTERLLIGYKHGTEYQYMSHPPAPSDIEFVDRVCKPCSNEISPGKQLEI